ncbi:MAG: hypothetical protein QM535_07575 [Limnohabitans sp.]|nr:hypothetical protein [Limnohabitans sp.]
MGHQDDIFEKFKKAADNQEAQDFPGMEKVWSRVDAKLDTHIFKAQKQVNSSWKKFAVAATVVVGTIFAFQVWKQYNPKVEIEKQQNSIVEKKTIETNTIVNDTMAPALVEAETEIEGVVINKKEAEQILHNQLKSKNPVAINETNKPNAGFVNLAPIPSSSETPPRSESIVKEYDDTDREKTGNSVGVSHTQQEVTTEYKTAKARSDVSAKKAPALLVVDGEVNGKKVLDSKNIEDEINLEEPLYIINGKEYTEKELFGPHPTSPYYPIDKQEIESLQVYQDAEAVEMFGSKGEKGVVVIKTKNGKPLKK